MKVAYPVIAPLLALSLAACGSPAPVAKPAADTVVGVFTSATDCAASGKLDLKACEELLARALAVHQQNAKHYISMRQCEEAEGADRCEKSDSKTFRRSLLAFQVAFSTPPTSAPLYASKEKDVIGFVTMDKSKTYHAHDETLIFSADAKVVAQANVTLN